MLPDVDGGVKTARHSCHASIVDAKKMVKL